MPKDKKFKSSSSTTIGSFSKNLLGLKFMQRAKQELEKKASDKEDSFDFSLCKNIKNNKQYVINPSYQFCERLRFGRFSFNGMNFDIENMMINNSKQDDGRTGSKKRQAPASDISSDEDFVSDEEDDGTKGEEEELGF